MASPLVSLPEILAAPDLGALLARYRARNGALPDRALLALLRSDWQALADGAAASAQPPTRFEPIAVEHQGCRFEIFGVIHGIVGGDDAAYMRFVADGLEGNAHLLVENGIGYYYRQPRNEWIPDFVVLGAARSAWLGLTTAFKAPLVFWDLASELLHRGRASKEPGAFDPAYHGMDPDVRRGLDADAALPARLEIPLALERYGSLRPRAIADDPVACVPRSLFMAGYAVGACERDGLSHVALLVGDLHTTEIAWFLSHATYAAHPLFLRGVAFASSRRLGAGSASQWKRPPTWAAVVGMAPIVAPLVLLASWLWY